MIAPELNKPENNTSEPVVPKVEPPKINYTGVSADDDLLAKLKEATEHKPDPNISKKTDQESANSVTNEQKPLKEEPKPEPGHFRPPGMEEPKPTETPKLPYDQQSELLIAFVDGLDCLIMPWGYQRTIFNDTERKRLKEIKRIKESKSLKAFQELNESDKELLERYKDYEDLVKDVPFTRAEVDLTKTPLAAVMEKYNMNLGPEILLMGALFTLMAPRLMPMFSKLERL